MRLCIFESMHRSKAIWFENPNLFLLSHTQFLHPQVFELLLCNVCSISIFYCRIFLCLKWQKEMRTHIYIIQLRKLEPENRLREASTWKTGIKVNVLCFLSIKAPTYKGYITEIYINTRSLNVEKVISKIWWQVGSTILRSYRKNGSKNPILARVMP